MVLVKVKVCGITNVDDALAAIDMGADILGFNFYPPSPRYITGADAIKVIDKLPTFIETAGVFVNSDYNEIKAIDRDGILNWAQLHGDETPEFCDSLKWLNLKTIKAIRVKTARDIRKAELYPTDAILFDGYHVDLYGGTGKTFDWSMLGHINNRVFLAGGLNCDNAAKAIAVGVYGIDVCSGIESKPGKKDHKKMKKFFDNIRHLVA